MMQRPAFFYQFAGLHGFLTGLLPFFLPVMIWREWQSLTVISGFIAASGFGFLVSLLAWERLRTSRYQKMAVAGSFILEAVFIIALVLTDSGLIRSISGLGVLALLNGAYGCFYWLSLRTLFIQQEGVESNHSSGNRFGNFQIIVGVLLKAGILAGAFLLESELELWLVSLSCLVSLAGIISVYSPANHHKLGEALSAPPVKFGDVASLNMGKGAKPVFILDGLFLFLESYFWVISLYGFSSESVSRLGGLVVILAVALSLLFLGIKKWIDKTDASSVFRLAVVLYAGSWLLRGLVSSELHAALFSIVVLVIAFMTSFFRLAFNKLFFDQIEPAKSQVFILAKSWYSQWGVVISFGLLMALLKFGNPFAITQIYWLVSPMALGYICYTSLACVRVKPVYL